MSALVDRVTALNDAGPASEPGLPDWFQARQKNAWQRFLETPTPKRGDENWRFANFKQLDFSAFSADTVVPEETGRLIERSRGVESPVARYVFANESLIEIDSSLPDEVVCLPLSEALLIHGELVEKHFMRRGSRLGSAKWAALHEARVRDGVFIHVPDGVEVEGVIEVHHWLAGAGSTIFPHTLVVTGTHARVKVVDFFRSENDADPGLCIAFNDLDAGPGSKLDYLAIQDLNEESRTILINKIGVARDAAALGFLLNIGGRWVRNESVSRLEGEGARSDMLGVNVPHREQEYDQRTFQHHQSPGATSDLLYKNSLYDESRTIFSGLISVDEGAHRTDAYQTCRNLLMSDKAEANSMPGLEINADDVKCSHGSTSARISDEEIFYLCSRGVDPDHARQLIARGFSVDVIERLRDEPLQELALRFLDAKFARIAHHRS